MASIIRIKRSTTAGDPTTLGNGELAYSAADSSTITGGDRLYIGIGSETAGNASSHIVIGGKFFTDMLDHAKGTLTANSAIITDANSKIDNLKVDNLDLNGNTISSTDTNGNIILDPNGTGYVSIVGTNGAVIPVGTTAQRGPAVQGTVRYNTDTSSFEGYSGTTWGSLGGVKSVDGLTYITAESSPGASDDTLSFITNGTEAFAVDTDSLDIAAKIATVNINATTASSSTTTGALVVDGGVGVAGALNVGGLINAQSATFSNINNTPIGNTTPSTGAFTTLSASGATTLNGDVNIGAVTLQEYIQDVTGGQIVDSTEIDATYDDTAGTTSLALKTTTVTAGSYGSSTAIPTFTVDSKGRLTAAGTANVGTTLNIAGDTGTDGVALLTDTLTVAGGEGVDVAVTNNTITISGEDASDTNKGIASFASSGFNVTAGVVTLSDTVVKAVTTDSGAMSMGGNAISILGGEGIDVTHTGTSITVTGEYASGANAGIASFSATNFNVSNVGDVSIKDGGVANAKLINSAVTIGSTSVSLGATQTALAGLTELTVDNLNINGNTITSTDTNGGITLDPNGTGHVSVSGALLRDVATPLSPTDAANKAYVDAIAEGLHIHASVQAATTAPVTGSVTYDNGTDGVGATLTTDTPINTLDGYSLVNGDRVLIKNQVNAAHNGIYIRTSSTVFTRSADFNTTAEIASGDFMFISNGTVNGKTGWVQIVKSIAIGTTNVTFEQFSGAGTYIAGSGLAFTGNTIDIVLQSQGGLEIVSDELGLKSTVAGTGLDYTNGVLSLETTLAGTGLTYNAGVINLNIATNGGLEVDGSDNLQLKSTVAGTGLTLTSGVLDVVGTADRITANSNSIDIASTYVGQNSITTLGTITTGTWQGSVIAALYGGTGQSSYSVGDLLVASGASALSKLTIGTTGKVLQSNGTTLVYADLDGGTYA
jgi:hypothetical protein